MRAPGAGSERKPIADYHVVVCVKTVGNFVENSGVFVVRDQTIPDRGILISDIEPNSRAVIADELAFLEDDPARQDDFIAASCPLAIKPFCVVVANGAAGNQKIV